MTESRSNNFERISLLASSMGGAFFLIWGTGLWFGSILVNADMLGFLGLAGAIVVVLQLISGGNRLVSVFAVLFSLKALVLQMYWPEAVRFGVPLLVGISLILVIAGLIRNFHHIGAFLVLSGAMSGALLSGLLSDFHMPVTNGVILVGAALEFLTGRMRIRSGGDGKTIYRRMIVIVVVPCTMVFIGGMSGRTWICNTIILMGYVVFAAESLKTPVLIWLDPFHHELRKRLAAFAATLPAGTRVLDAGAGESQYSQFFGHCTTVGVDLAVGDADWDYSALDIVGDLHAIPLHDGAMDAVVCTVTLEHLHSPWLALEEMGRVVRTGGSGFFVVPFMWELHQEPHDYFRYSPHAIRHLADLSGFDVMEIIPMGGLFRVLHYRFASLLKHARRRPLLLVTILPFLPVIGGYLLISGIVDRVWKLCDHTLGYTVILTKRGEP